MTLQSIPPIHREEQRPLELDRLTARLCDIEIVTGSSGFQLDQQLTIPHALIVLLHGEGVLTRADGACNMCMDTVYVCPPESTFGMTGGTSGEFSAAVIRFHLYQESSRSRKRMQAVRPEGLLPEGEGIYIAPAGRLHALCRSMKEHSCSSDALVRWRAQLDCQELLYELLAAARRQPEDNTRHSLERAKAYMEAHSGEEITIDRLAAIAELSPKYFVDLFKKTYGVSALDHLTHLRIHKAKQLMLRSDLLLREIAHEVGYGDEFYFSRKFRKVVGLSPTAFIKKRRHRIVVYGSASLIGYLLPLGVVPYAAPLHPKWSGYYYDQLGADIPIHLDAYRQNHYKGSNLDKLASAQPELIICPPDLDEWEKDRLADTAAEIYEMPGDGMGWRKKLLAVAALLGEEAEAERWIAAYERKAELARGHIGPLAGRDTVLTLRLLKNQFYVHCSLSMSEVLYDGLGLRSPFADKGAPFDHRITLAELDAIRADHILLLICKESETLEGWSKLQQSPEWLSLQAVRENKVRLITSEPWREYSPIALVRMLDIAQELFSGNRP
ncbi:helix-turn-helix domain-containing protein [Paenibacillus oenotherae]|uniref:Helix-turn-helix domain-containing protein n=1 Tax=Paenibacillus oenotherae TaxID=1435645 RepID=A0ABS7D6A7_9BACL|nr:helix-turn-helix domain-containing protein [Paenibacillus oenotherae]MBW7475472.1 helix-turn-helix domain-containing protein [Paenibacillus oenotherae]